MEKTTEQAMADLKEKMAELRDAVDYLLHITAITEQALSYIENKLEGEKHGTNN